MSRELPKRKGQSQHDKDMEDEETFHMSGVGTQRYCAPEILTTRRYNLKADVYSWSMVFLELVTLNKPFQEYDPEEHVLNVAKLGERPRLVDIEGDPQEVAGSYDSVSPLDKTEAGECTSSDDEENKGKPKKKKASLVSTNGWPSGVSALLENSWRQDVGERLSIDAVLQRLQTIIDQFESYLEKSEKAAEKLTAASGGETGKDPINREVVLEFPSHFSPRHQLPTFNQVQAAHQQEGAPQEHITMQMNRQDSDCNSGDKQSEQSATSYLELTITSVSTTLHDSNSTE